MMKHLCSLAVLVTLLGGVTLRADEEPQEGVKKRLFKKLDTNKDGKLSKEEFSKIGDLLSQKASKLKDNPEVMKRVVEKMFEHLDANNDGFLSQEEFMKIGENAQGLKGKLDLEKLKELKQKLDNKNQDPNQE